MWWFEEKMCEICRRDYGIKNKSENQTDGRDM
jgi:hypothetical protein